MGFLSSLQSGNRRSAFAFGEQTAEVMLESSLAVMQNEPGILPGEVCKQVLNLRPHWGVRKNGIVEFHDKAVSDWLPGKEGTITKIKTDTTVGDLTLTVIATEYTNLFTEHELRSEPLIKSALDGCSKYFEKAGLVI